MSEGRIEKRVGRFGCLVSILAPILALVIYPAAKWLFVVPLVFVAILFLVGRFQKDPSPGEIADFAEKLLNGKGYGWDVDDYEHLHPRNPAVRELWAETMSIGGLPEEWRTIDEFRKQQLRNIISSLR